MICECYRADKNFLGKVGLCWGTQERDACSCGGDKSKCDFYPTVREEVKKPVTNYDLLVLKTPEELAEFIAYSTSCETCVVRKGGSDECHNTNCSTAWLDYLKQEVTND